MRVTQARDGMTVRAIAGTNVVELAFDVDPALRQGLLGFAVRRRDGGEGAGPGEWIVNRRTFAGQEQGRQYWPTDQAPVQKFRWGDYTVEPGKPYRYEVAAAHGSPGDVRLGPSVELTVATEDGRNVTDPADGIRHEVHFNRSGAASQSYVDRFDGQTPEQAGEPALRWLSRGLLEAMTAFIASARKGDALHVAMYEAQYQKFLQPLKDAADRGVTVQILYDAGSAPTAPTTENHDALRAAGLLPYSRARAGLGSHISHHKFIVLVRGGTPAAVWTGSTNMTEHAVYAQLNVGHAVYSGPLARTYLTLHQALWNDDPPLKDTRALIERAWPSIPPAPRDGPGVVFSPRSHDEAMEYYLSLMSDARHLVVLTTPFGVDKRIEDYLVGSPPAVVKFGLVGAPGPAGGQIQRLDSIDGTRYVMPARIEDNTLSRWQIEQWGEESHVYIHTKFLLIDPLDDEPTLVTGSANFSHASCADNDEDMLLISGHRSVADVYLTEFLRMFDHYAFRQLLHDHRTGIRSLALAPDDTWTAPYFREGSQRQRERLLFSGAGPGR